MTELLYANPRKRSRKGKMPAGLKRYWASRRGQKSGRKTSRKSSRRSSRKRSSARGVTVVTVNRNPAPRAARGTHRKSYSRARAFGSKIGGLVPSELYPAVIGAAGALALDMGWGHLPLPDSIKQGTLAPLARLALALGVGLVASKFAGKKFGQEVAVGAITVSVFDLAKSWLQANTQIQLNGMGMFVDGRMGMFVDGLGYRSPALFSPDRGLGYSGISAPAYDVTDDAESYD